MSERAQRGSSLIEVLVAVTVVSVGSLSMASLQLLSKRNLQDADQRLEATQLANGLLERLRANAAADALRVYTTSFQGGVGDGRFAARLNLPGNRPPSPSCADAGAGSCSPAELARFDAWLWERLLDGAREQSASDVGARKAGGLVSPVACLAPPATGAGTAGVYTLTIAFRGTAALPVQDDPRGCGRGARDERQALFGEADEFRRTVVVQAYLIPAVPR